MSKLTYGQVAVKFHEHDNEQSSKIKQAAADLIDLKGVGISFDIVNFERYRFLLD